MDQLYGILIDYWPFWVGLAVFTAIMMLLRMYAVPPPMPYYKRKSLVTKSELRFFKALQKAVLDEWEIFAMVRIADLIQVQKGNPQGRKWLNKILAKHIDFVLCDPMSLEPVLAIELDDASHQRADRIERDEFVNDAMEAADLPLLRIPVEDGYSAREVKDLIDEILG